MEFEIRGKCILKLAHQKGDKKSTHIATDFNLDVSENLERSEYLDKEGFPTALGSKSLTICFVQALVGNIHQAHQRKQWNDVEHLKFIISELEKGFATVADASKSEFTS